jgi:DNA polymerase III epsilon subunit-like protein
LEWTFYRELKPISHGFVPEALSVSKLSVEELAFRGADPPDVMRQFARWVRASVGGRRPVMVGFNSAFDWSFINWYFLHYGDENPFGIGALDIKSYYMGLAGIRWVDTRSSRIPEALRGPSVKHSHNAVEDAIEQAAMFARMLASRV